MSPAQARYQIPAQETQIEQEIKRSKFIATGTYVSHREEAETWLSELRKTHVSASHNCPAYKIGYGSSLLEWSSDDGEPRGTAGRPMLSVLQGSDLYDIVVVVTRYSSGIKLGTGGLVRAYSGAVRELLIAMPTKELVAKSSFYIELPYTNYQQGKELLLENEAEIDSEDFSDQIIIKLQLPDDRYKQVQALLTETFHGKRVLKKKP